MPHPRYGSRATGRKLLQLAAAVALLIVTSQRARTQVLTFYSFSGPDGEYSQSNLILDAHGNLYGTTYAGGASGWGTVFEFTPNGTETVLHSFHTCPCQPPNIVPVPRHGPEEMPGIPAISDEDGRNPTAGLVVDPKGNLWGTTYTGGNYEVGTVFRLSPDGTVTILHSFNPNNGDGAYPSANVVFDSQGNIYGTTQGGGAFGRGTVFKLTPGGTETVLHSFSGYPQGDGSLPFSSLAFDSAGNLYGTTLNGGTADHGTVFKLTPDGKQETILHSFSDKPDGADPAAGVVFDANGNLFGTTWYGGAAPHGWSGGTVFEIAQDGTESVLYSFCSLLNCSDGAGPKGALIMDTQGNLYGTTTTNSASSDKNGGTVFKLSPSGKETVLHSFTGFPNDGSYPVGSLVMDAQGNLYGTTEYGGDSSACYAGCGTVFKLTR